MPRALLDLEAIHQKFIDDSDQMADDYMGAVLQKSKDHVKAYEAMGVALENAEKYCLLVLAEAEEWKNKYKALQMTKAKDFEEAVRDGVTKAKAEMKAALESTLRTQ